MKIVIRIIKNGTGCKLIRIAVKLQQIIVLKFFLVCTTPYFKNELQDF